jgi:hypothetical protein
MNFMRRFFDRDNKKIVAYPRSQKYCGMIVVPNHIRSIFEINIDFTAIKVGQTLPVSHRSLPSFFHGVPLCLQRNYASNQISLSDEQIVGGWWLLLHINEPSA